MISQNVYELPVKKDLKDITNDEIIFSNTINEPSMNLGFQYFIHRKKDEMSITNNLSKFYYIVNPYEHIINDYDDDLLNISKKYLSIKDKDPKILSRAFYKLWEILFVFDLAKESKMTYAGLAEGPGAFIQAVIHFRKKFYDIKKDKVFGVTIHPENKKDISMAKQFLGHYNDLVPKMVNIHKTYDLKTCKKYNSKKGSYKARDNGDITNINTISNFKKSVLKSKKYADLVTADGGFVWDNENYQEMESYQLVLGQMVAAIRVQDKGGSFVLKIFETFTSVSLKIIYLLSSFYNKCYIYKPFYSRESNSEKYVVFKDFKYDQKKDSKYLDSKIKILENLLEKMSSDKYVFDIFPNLELPKDFVNTFIYLNTKIANSQQIMINDIITYIKENNYYGEKYHNYKKNQIEKTKEWSGIFLPESKKDFSSLVTKLKSDLNKKIDFNNKEVKLFVSKLN